MAVFQAIFAPGSNPDVQSGTITTGTSSGDIVFSNRQIIAVTTSGDAFIRFGNSTTIINAATTDRPIWGKSYQEWDLGDEFDRFRIFNNGGSSITWCAFSLSRGK